MSDTPKYPTVNIMPIGPGTQPSVDGEEDAPILNMPSGMDIYNQPILPEPEDVENLKIAKEVLANTLEALQRYKVGEEALLINLNGIDPDNIDLVNQALGEGEVSVILDGPAPVMAQESVLAGVWRVQHQDTEGNVILDSMEVADIPHVVRTLFKEVESDTIDLSLDGVDPAILNAPPLLVEITDVLKEWQPGMDPHVINLTLLPLTEDELNFIGHRLGVGPATILSRGYGNCRIGSTKIENVWWIKYFNSEDKIILNTIEVSDVPPVALAAQEDLDDSAERLVEILELYQ